MSNINNSRDYDIGFHNGFKDGYRQALEDMRVVEQQKLSTNVKLCVECYSKTATTTYSDEINTYAVCKECKEKAEYQIWSDSADQIFRR